MSSARCSSMLRFSILVLVASTITIGAHAASPTISSLSVSSGPVGTAVTITGTNFGSTQGSSTVAFNGTTATVTSWGSTSIAVTVPTAATTGNVVVTVSGVASNGKSFTVTPKINSLSPTSGAVGAAVTITGTTFGTTQGTVKFNGTTASITSWSSTSIGVTVPSGATTGNVVVTASSQTSNGVSFTVLATPSITSLSPTSDAVGAAVTITGSNFGSSQGSGTVKFNGTTATVTSWAAGSIGVTVPSGATTGNVVVNASGVNTNGVNFTVLATPSITSLSPTSDAVGAAVTITGANFGSMQGSGTVKFNGTTATVTSWAAGSIGVTVPSGATTGNVVVNVSGVNTNGVNFTVLGTPSITSLSPSSGIIGATVTIAGSNFGSSQGNGTVTFNGTTATVTSWAAGSISVLVPTGATTGNVIVNAEGVNTNGVNFAVTNLPTGWSDGDIGTVGLTGSASYGSGTFTVNGAGVGIAGTSDGFHFAYQPLSGDGTIVARVVNLPLGEYSAAGVMIRETLTPGSTFAYTNYQGIYDGIYFGYRNSTGGSFEESNPKATSLPYWVQMVRSGNTFSSFVSMDGVNWTQLGTSQTINMAQNVYVGLAVTSGSTSSLATATFDSVSVSSDPSPAPTIGDLSATTGSIGSQVVITGTGFGATPNGSLVTLNGSPMTINSWTNTSIVITISAGATSGNMLVSVAPSMNDSNPVMFAVTTQPLPTSWLDQDIGIVGLTGSATYSNGTFTVNAAGMGVIGSTDSLHFVYQPLSGNGTIVARIVSLPGTGSSMAGVMIRETLAPNATFAYTNYEQPYGSIYLSYRTTTGSTSSESNPVSPALPYWVELVRNGSTFSSYVSMDGVNWTQLGTSQTIDMAQNVYEGLAVTSGSTSTLETATFDSVSINSDILVSPAITGVSATTGAIGNQVTVYGTGFGSTQGSSVVLLHGLATTINSWAPTSITLTIPAGATSGPLEVLLGPTMNSSNAIDFEVTPQPLPLGWLDQDIGTVGLSGSATYSSGTFTVNGAGTGIGGTSDGFQFVYQPLSGNGTMVAQIVSLQGEPYAAAGVMIRETLTPGSTFAYTNYQGTGDIYFSYRATTGSSSSESSPMAPALPYWLKVVRVGSTFTSYIAPDGVNWTQLGTSQTINMAQNVYVGLAVTYGSISNLATATFDDETFTPGTMPMISSMSPSAGGFGASVTISGSNFGASQGTSTISFNGVAATSIASWTNSQIVATVPSAATTGPVIVAVNSIQSNTNFTYTVINPILSTITPAVGQAGATVTLTGSGFGTNQGTSQLLFNGASAGILSWSGTSITAAVPTGATSGPVTLVEGGVTSNGLPFSVETLSVTSISPTSGPVGTQITITGTGFGPSQSNSTVSFFGTAAAVQSWSDTQIVAVVPSGIGNGPVQVGVASVLWYANTFDLTTTLQVTDSQNHQTTYTAKLIGGNWLPLVGQGSGCSTCTQRGNISYGYDNKGNALTRIDENGNMTSYSYDVNNNLISVTAPISSTNSATTAYTYNSFGEVLTVTDPLGFVTTSTYDTNGNLLSVTTPAPGNGASASVTQFAYNSLGELTKITDPLNNQTNIAYFPSGLIQTITDAQSNVTTYAYDSQGNRTSVTDALNKQTTFTYDAMNRLTKITYPDTTTSQFAYDVRGRRISVTDQNGKLTAYAYDDADRLLTVTDAANNVTTYGYDTESNLTSIQDANHNTTNFSYDAFGRVIQTTFPSGYIETYGYDNIGNLTSKTDRKNQLITYTYDQLNRLTQKSYPDTTTVNYTYDNDSRLTQVTDPTGTYQFTFDNMGRLSGTSTQYAFLTSRSFTTSYGYDSASNRTGFTDPENGSSSYVYDTLNRLHTLTPPAAISGGNFGFGYDDLSRRTSLTRPNTVNTSYGYDTLSRLLNVTHAIGSTTLDGATYTLDNAGNRLTRAPLPTGTTSTFGYDNIYELLSVTQGSSTTESYTYDPVGNRLTDLGSASWTYNTSNELTARPSVSYTFDNNGNTQTMANASGTTTYSWDFENRLTSAALPGSGGTVTFKYDPFGRRIYKSSSSGTSIYAYDGDNLIEETNSSGAAVARYSQTRKIDEPLAMLRSGITSYYEADGIGSITSLSTSTGALANTYAYDSFGNLTASAGSLTNPFRFTAREFDSETALQFSRARYYDPIAGRFISEDPTRFDAGLNFYESVLNNPVNYTDPLGLKTSVCCRPLRYVVGKLGLTHCYVSVSEHGGKPHTYGLHREDSNNNLFPGGPKPIIDDPTDVGGTCKDVKDATPCKEINFESRFNTVPCPSCGDNYFFMTTNSNFWVSNTLKQFGMTPPSFSSAPGYNYVPYIPPYGSDK